MSLRLAALWFDGSSPVVKVGIGQWPPLGEQLLIHIKVKQILRLSTYLITDDIVIDTDAANTDTEVFKNAARTRQTSVVSWDSILDLLLGFIMGPLNLRPSCSGGKRKGRSFALKLGQADPSHGNSFQTPLPKRLLCHKCSQYRCHARKTD
ncbi:hypothetical protein F2P81_001527 [Scophthalmus maximus]|uniref:Uncharacterized protein n=1 Tax=Scophthalmus maximus TaxID=52904 RepID=A0A6A4TKJ3_SCOMX|nr:hypothetical protein F2P81_001527 [Scophthalmus maximus]